MVLFNHTGTKGFVLFTVAQSSKLYVLYLFFAIFIKIAVPLFFMTSGALLLGKEESYKDLLCKRIFKYSLILVIISAISYFYYCWRLNSQKLSLTYFLSNLYRDSLSTALWFLYAYLAYLFMLPFLRKLAKTMTNQDYQWMFFLFGAINCLPILDFLIWKGAGTHNNNFSFFITTNYVFYPLFGYYIDQRMPETSFTVKKVLAASAISVMAICICCFMTHYKCTLTGDWDEWKCQTFFNTLIFLPTITVYYGAKLFFQRHKISPRLQKMIVTVSETTFGIFLFEKILRNETLPVFTFLKPYLHTMPACLIWILCACVLGSCLIFVLKKIPVIKYYL